MPTIPRPSPAVRSRLCLMATTLSLLAGCGSSDSVPNTAIDRSRELDATLMPTVQQVRAWQAEIDTFDHGFRPAGSVAEIAYAQHLAAQLRAMGVPEVSLEPYDVRRWAAKQARLQLGDAGEDVPLAAYIPFSGNTGPEGIEGNLVYLPGLAAIDLTTLVLKLLDSGAIAGSPAELATRVMALLADGESGVAALAAAIAAANVRDRIVVYDLPKPPIPLGALRAAALHVTDNAGTMGAATPYSRPFLDMVVAQLITSLLKSAGAAGAVAVIDYPAEAANGSYYPFFAPTLPAVPTLYLDRDTGRALKQRLAANPGRALPAHLTLDAQEESVQAYNVVALLPGASPLELILSSHTDGTNSIEDNGPAAIIALMRYFSALPQAQRKRSLRVVFSGGHFGGGGLAQYVERHHAELQESVLAAIELEHLGAREWLEVAPGVMALTGLNEPQVVVTPLGEAFQRESIEFAKQFDRTLVLPPVLPFGEGQVYRTEGGLPMIQYITGPVYLLNYGMPKVTTEYTDYTLMHAQIGAFVRMVLNLGNEPAAALRPELRER